MQKHISYIMDQNYRINEIPISKLVISGHTSTGQTKIDKKNPVHHLKIQHVIH